MASVGALTGPYVPLGKQRAKFANGGCGGSHMNSVGAFPEQYVPLCKGMVDPANTPDTVVYQQATGMYQLYQKKRKEMIERIQVEPEDSTNLKTTHTAPPDYSGSVNDDPFETMHKRVQLRMNPHPDPSDYITID
ncbi:expressed unknown protein [Seminavis robusta]|uniref:Uncharacterized protein n=1 Tax=Seminavis robusta TaxID=568900 RepID=A0A9N8DPX2_9STRA|nr:expressed unknown protein [Seminavis robusta]|eukprot:Sro201_g085100.1 n/a (135) ;mRNA; r:55029-55433